MPKINLNNIELYYEEYGNSKDVIILLHSFLSSSKMWLNNYVPDLMKRYKVYTIDARGHGNSNGVKTGCNLQQMADDIYQFVILKNIDKCILAGTSMGGAIAIQFAINFPDKMKSLILMNPGPGSLFSKGFSFISPVLSFVSQKKFLLKPLLKSVLINKLPQNVLSEFVNDAALVSKETWLQYLHPDNKIHNYDKLKNLTIPTLVIISGKDRAIPIEYQENVADTIPKAVKIIMNDEGHAVVIENPKKVLSKINSFLKESLKEQHNILV
ncbi:MAG: alpha/beta hydrolase [Ignavibacterium sp.]|nr:MAG: alpha/beta hydrolase [Ignavibacterium sp.]